MNPQLGVLAGRSLFTVAGRTYAWEDVLLAAELRGDLGELEHQTRLGLACLHRLAAEPDALPAETLRAAATVFRYEHNLLAAEGLEAWLDARGLSVSDWNGYLRRLVLRERWAGELDRIVSEYSVDDDVVEAALTAEAICWAFSAPRPNGWRRTSRSPPRATMGATRARPTSSERLQHMVSTGSGSRPRRSSWRTPRRRARRRSASASTAGRWATSPRTVA